MTNNALQRAPSINRRYLALWFPTFSTDRVRKANDWRDNQPLVLVERQHGAIRLAAVDQHAQKLGLRAGLTLADARARKPDLRAVEASPKADGRLLLKMALFCDRFSPLVGLSRENARTHSLTLDIAGVAHLFGGEALLRKTILQRFVQKGFFARGAIADTPEAAHAMARFSALSIAPEGENEAVLRDLPIRALCYAQSMEQETEGALLRAGVKTLGQMAALPPQTIAARFGESIVRSLSYTLARENRRMIPLRPAPDFLEQCHFAEPILLQAQIEKAANDLASSLCASLERHGRGGRQFQFQLFRSDGVARKIRVETSRPCRDPSVILRLLKTRVNGLADPIDPGFGFDALRLSARTSEPLAMRQIGFDGASENAHALTDLMDHLIARFGSLRVRRLATINTHDPLRANGSAPASAPALETNFWPLEAGEPPARPLYIFDPPQPIDVLAETPDGPPKRFSWRRGRHEVALAEGPERIAPEWWRQGQGQTQAETRDYYRIEDRQGYRFWVFRQGLYGEAAAPRWFIQGLFA